MKPTLPKAVAKPPAPSFWSQATPGPNKPGELLVDSYPMVVFSVGIAEKTGETERFRTEKLGIKLQLDRNHFWLGLNGSKMRSSVALVERAVQVVDSI